MSIGNNIKKYRKLRELSQSELAEISGISRVAIGNYERGTRTPNVDILGKIATGLNVPFNELVHENNLDNTDNYLKAYVYHSQGYIESKKLELLSEIAFIASKETDATDNFSDLLLFWLNPDEQCEIANFIVTSFKVKFYEIYSGKRKDDIQREISELNKDLEDGIAFPPKND